MNNSAIPEGYEVPSWPSLALPYGPIETRKILYNKSDVVKYVILWSMYINTGICAISSFFTFISIRKKRYIPIIIVAYGIYGGLIGIVNGFIFGMAFWYIIEPLGFSVLTIHPLFIGIIQGALFRILEIPNVRMNTM